VNPMLESLPKRLGSVVSRRESFALALTGEPGLGKSFQLDRVLNQLTCRSVHLPASASGPQMARSFVRNDRVPSWALRSLERLESGETLEPARVADAITAYLVANAPVVLRLEDLHEANPAQLEVWSGVARGLKGTRGVALLASGRGAPPEAFEHVRLEALDVAASRSMLEAQIGAVLPDAALDWIQARANGNPLFTLEYFRFLARSGFLWSDARRWRWRDPGTEIMPTSVEALVAQSLEPLREDAVLEATLRARAVLPDDDRTRWLAVAQVSADQLEAARRRLELDGLLQHGGLQPIVATVIRATLEGQVRRDLSRRAIRALEQDWPAMAALLVDDADLDSQAAIALFERGAAVSLERQAAQFLVRAAERSVPADRARRSLLAARALQRFDTDEALRLVMLAGALEPNDQTTLLEAELLAAQGRFLEAERCAGRLNPESKVQWLELLLEARYRLDDDSGVLEIWESNPSLQDQASVTLRVRVGYALVQLGRFEQARDLYRQILEAKLCAEDRAWVLSAAAIVELDAGDLQAAAEGFSRSLEAFDHLDQLEASGSLVQARRIAALANRSMVRYRLGDFKQAIQDLEVVLAHHSENGDGRSFAEVQTNLGTYLIAQGEFERAEEVLLEARAVLERITVGAAHRGENPRMLSLAEQGLVQLYLEWGPPHGAALALRHAQAAERAARGVQNPTNLAQTLFYCAWAEAVHGRPERAQSMLEELMRLAQEFKLEPMRIAANWVQGLALERLGRVETAREQITRASQQMRALGHPAYAQRLAFELDRIGQDAQSAQMRLEDLSAYPGWLAVAQRYFPQAFEAKSKPVKTPLIGAARLNVLGPLGLESNFEPITPPALQGKILLALLLEARLTGRDGVKTLELLDRLYPEHEENMGMGALKQLVFRTRASLGKAAILRISDGYALGTLETDAETFLASGATFLWRGPLLNDLPEDIAPALRDAMGQALQLSAKSILETDPLEAARLAEIMRESDPYDLSVLQFHLRALEICADLRKLERTYAQARAQLREVGEDLPESWQAYLKQV
jgi:tetratricopeptide (TPR) repeat protein